MVNLFRSLEKVVGCHELFVWTVRSSTHDCPVRLSFTDVQCCWPVANLCGLVVQLSGVGLVQVVHASPEFTRRPQAATLRRGNATWIATAPPAWHVRKCL